MRHTRIFSKIAALGYFGILRTNGGEIIIAGVNGGGGRKATRTLEMLSQIASL
jgi:hypothetical protein